MLTPIICDRSDSRIFYNCRCGYFIGHLGVNFGKDFGGIPIDTGDSALLSELADTDGAVTTSSANLVPGTVVPYVPLVYGDSKDHPNGGSRPEDLGPFAIISD